MLLSKVFTHLFHLIALQVRREIMSGLTLDTNIPSTPYYIKFYPGLKTSLGCEKATLVLGRLEYWFEKYKNGFYKFVEPCGHPLYREGDSWEEEMGFSRKIFAKAFDLVGVRYKSKSAFRNAKDKFQGKLYASYHDRKTNQTYFVRNHKFASEFIKGIFKRRAHLTPLKQRKVVEDEKPNVDIVPSLKKGRSWNGQKCRSYGGIIGGKENNSIQRKTPSLENPIARSVLPALNPQQKEVTEEMIKIWKEEIGELGVSSVSNRLMCHLQNSLEEFFEHSLDSWKTYCRMISSSKFLMGESQNKFFKKAWITWAIKKDVIERIKGGDFNLGDRYTNEDRNTQKINHKIKNLENKKEVIKEKINNIKTLLQGERIKKCREKIKAFSEKDMENFKEKFINFLEEENNSMTKEFRALGWKGIFIESYFESFLEETLASQLFTRPLQEETDEAIKASGFLDLLDSICEEICLLEKQRKLNNEIIY